MSIRRMTWRGAKVAAAAAVVAMVATACVNSGSTAISKSAEPAPSGSTIQPIAPSEPTSPVTLTFESWVGDSPQMKKFASDFHKLHPNITIQFQNVSADNASTKLTTQIAGGTAPDVAFLDASSIAGFASHGALLNLDGYIAGSKDQNLSDYVPAFLEAMKYNAEFAPESAYYWWPFLWQAGGHLMSSDGKAITFDSPQGQEAAKFYIGLAKYSPPDYYGSNSWDARVAFATGKVAMYEAGSWFGGEMESTFSKQTKGKWNVAPMPAGPAGCATTIAGDSIAVLAQTKNADAAFMWIDYLTSPAILKQWTYGSPTTTLIPTRTSLLNDPSLGKYNPWLKGFADQMKCAVNDNLNNPKWPQISDVLNTQLGKAIYGDVTATEALASAAQKGEQILQSSNG